MGSFNETHECKCMLSGFTCPEVLELAPCPPPFFYNDFAEYAFSRCLSSWEVCTIATRCMSKYTIGNSQNIIASICSPTTTTTTSTTTTTTSTTTTTTVTTRTTTPLSPVDVKLAALSCNAACIAGTIAVLVFAAIAVFIAILILKRRGKLTNCLTQIRKFFGRCCKGRKGDRTSLVTGSKRETTVGYDNKTYSTAIYMANNIITNENRSTSREEIRVEAHTQECNTETRVEITNATAENFEKRFRRSEIDTTDYTDTSSDEEEKQKVDFKGIHSETNSMKTQLSGTLEMEDIIANKQNEEENTDVKVSQQNEEEKVDVKAGETSKEKNMEALSSDKNNITKENSVTEFVQGDFDNLDIDTGDALQGKIGQAKMKIYANIGDSERAIKTGEGEIQESLQINNNDLENSRTETSLEETEQESNINKITQKTSL